MPVVRQPAWTSRLLLIVLYGAAFWTLLLLKPWPHDVGVTVDDIADIGGSLIGVAFAFGAWWRPTNRTSIPGERQGRRHWAPRLLALSILSYALGSIVWDYYVMVLRQSPFPSWADPLYLSAYPFVLYGILLLPLRPLTSAARTRIILDGLMIMLSIVTFSWYFVLGPTIVQGRETHLATVIGTAYPLADLVIFLCVLILWSHATDAVLRPVVVVLAVGLGIIVLADSVFDYQGLHGGYTTGGLIDPLWALGEMLTGLGASLLRSTFQSGAAAQASSEAAAPTMAPSIWRTLLPYMLLPAVGLLVLYTVRTNGDSPLETGVYIGAAILSGLVLLRQVWSQIEVQRLYRDVASHQYGPCRGQHVAASPGDHRSSDRAAQPPRCCDGTGQ